MRPAPLIRFDGGPASVTPIITSGLDWSYPCGPSSILLGGLRRFILLRQSRRHLAIPSCYCTHMHGERPLAIRDLPVALPLDNLFLSHAIQGMYFAERFLFSEVHYHCWDHSAFPANSIEPRPHVALWEISSSRSHRLFVCSSPRKLSP